MNIERQKQLKEQENENGVQITHYSERTRIESIMSGNMPNHLKQQERAHGIKVNKPKLVLALFAMHVDTRENCYSADNVAKGWDCTGVNMLTGSINLPLAMKGCKTWKSMGNKHCSQLTRDLLLLRIHYGLEGRLSDVYCDEQNYYPNAYSIKAGNGTVIIRDDLPYHRRRAEMPFHASMLQRIETARVEKADADEEIRLEQDIIGSGLWNEQYFGEVQSVEEVPYKYRHKKHLVAILIHLNLPTDGLVSVLKDRIQSELTSARNMAIDLENESGAETDDDTPIAEILAATKEEEELQRRFRGESKNQTENERDEEEEPEWQPEWFADLYKDYQSNGGKNNMEDYLAAECEPDPGSVQCVKCGKWRRTQEGVDSWFYIEKWVCTDNNWDEAVGCQIPEELNLF